MCGASWSGRILCHPFLPSLPYPPYNIPYLPPYYIILTLFAIPTIIYHTYKPYHTIQTCPFPSGQDMSSVICKGQYTPILDHTTSHPKVFPCVVCLVMHEGSLWRQHKFSTQLILAPHPRRSLYMNIHIKTI